MSNNPNRLRELAETLDDWNHPLGSVDLCRRVADELDRLQTPVYDPDITEVVGTLTRGGLSYLADHVSGLVRNRDRLRLKVVDLGEQLARQAVEIERLQADNEKLTKQVAEWIEKFANRQEVRASG